MLTIPKHTRFQIFHQSGEFDGKKLRKWVVTMSLTNKKRKYWEIIGVDLNLQVDMQQTETSI